MDKGLDSSHVEGGLTDFEETCFLTDRGSCTTFLKYVSRDLGWDLVSLVDAMLEEECVMDIRSLHK